MSLKRNCGLFAALITTILSLPSANLTITASAEESASSEVIVNQSIEDDLATFEFDWQRYCINELHYYQPVFITFKESISNNYYDLFYFFVRTEKPESIKFQYIWSEGYCADNIDLNNSNCLWQDTPFKFDYQDYYQVDDTGYIFRLCSNNLQNHYDFQDYRSNFDYRFYELMYVDYEEDGLKKEMELNSNFLFNSNLLNLSYSNCLNINLQYEKAFSYHFDEDSSWDNFWDNFFGNSSDKLTDQFFYTFYVSDWCVDEIKSIDLRYKKFLLTGVTTNPFASDDSNIFFGSISEDFANMSSFSKVPSSFYAWNDNNSNSNLDTSVFLGHYAFEASSRVGYTKKTLFAENQKSVSGVGYNYEWNDIQSLDKFTGDIADSSFCKYLENLYDGIDITFKNKSNFFVINFDNFYYSYDGFYRTENKLTTYKDNHLYHQVGDNETRFAVDGLEEYEKFIADHMILGDDGYYYCFVHSFVREYITDLTATLITFEDAQNVTYTLPVSVAPAAVSDSVGGPSTSVFPDNGCDWNLVITIIAIIFGVLVVAILWPVIYPVFKFIFKIILYPFKLIGSWFNRRKK